MALILSVLYNLVIVLTVFFAVTLFVYFFNLDMKMASMMQPVLNKWYDHHKRRPLP